MNINIKQISFVILGLVIVTAIFGLSKFNIASAAKKDGKKFDDWVVSCSSANKETKTPEVCLLSQQLNLTQDDKQQPIALFQVGYFRPKKEGRKSFKRNPEKSSTTKKFGKSLGL